MKKKNSIFTLLLLFAFVSLCYLPVSYVKTNVGSDEKQKDLNLNILTTPKSSGYDVTEKWNYTSNYEVSVVAVSADGNYMAVGVTYVLSKGGDPSHDIFFFNTSDHNGIPMWSYDIGKPIKSISISANGKYIIASCWGEAYLFNSTVPSPGEEKEHIWFVDCGNIITSVDISADGKYIVLGYNEMAIALYNNSYASTGYDKTGEHLWIYYTNYGVLSVAISADGKYVAAGTEYPVTRDADPMDQIFFLNTTDYILGDLQMPMWSFDAGCSIDSIAISAYGEYIVAGSYDGRVAYLLNSTVPEPGEAKSEVWYVNWSFEKISTVDISADGKHIVVGVDASSEPPKKGGIFLYDNSASTNKKLEYRWRYQTKGIVNSVAITALGEYIVAGTDYNPDTGDDGENTVFLFNNTDYTLGASHNPIWFFNTSNDVNSVSMSAWGNYIAAGGDYEINGRTYLFYHARPIPRIISGNGGGGGGDDDGEEAIPFGNYYLLFTAIAVASLVIITKRKAIFSKKLN